MGNDCLPTQAWAKFVLPPKSKTSLRPRLRGDVEYKFSIVFQGDYPLVCLEDLTHGQVIFRMRPNECVIGKMWNSRKPQEPQPDDGKWDVDEYGEYEVVVLKGSPEEDRNENSDS